jgi:hypothetical protein
MSGFYSLKAEQPGGKIFDFAELKGKTVLIVNTASAWYVVLRTLSLVSSITTAIAASLLNTRVCLTGSLILSRTHTLLRPPILVR